MELQADQPWTSGRWLAYTAKHWSLTVYLRIMAHGPAVKS